LRTLRIALAALLLFATWRPRRVEAQACCAGAGAVTPARLAIHEDALVGVQARVADVYGTFSDDGKYVRSAATQWDFEQDLFGALRVARRAQVAVLVPVLQAYQQGLQLTDFGAGLGDVNLSGRYDFLLAGESQVVPGIAALGGVSLPTGRPPDASDGQNHPLGSDVTGIGVYQFHAGLALEQTWGPWLVGVTGLYAKRTSRTVQGMTTSLGAQWSVLAAAAYTFPNDAAIALVASYAVQVDNAPALGRKIPLLTLSGLYPLSDRWRLQGGYFFTPPVSHVGRNAGAETGVVFGVVRSWS
jgi:hypothetical protein